MNCCFICTFLLIYLGIIISVEFQLLIEFSISAFLIMIIYFQDSHIPKHVYTANSDMIDVQSQSSRKVCHQLITPFRFYEVYTIILHQLGRHLLEMTFTKPYTEDN